VDGERHAFYNEAKPGFELKCQPAIKNALVLSYTKIGKEVDGSAIGM
jgi:hypothetical protein